MKKRNRNKKIRLSLTLVLVCASLLCGCGHFSGQKKNYVLITGGRDFYSQKAADAFEKNMAKDGRTVTCLMPETISAENQLDLISDLEDETRIDCLAVCFNGSSVFQEGLEKLKENGTKIIAWGQMSENDSIPDLEVMEYPLDSLGTDLLDMIQDTSGGEIQIGILVPNGFVYNEMQVGRDIRKAIEEGKYPSVFLTEIRYTDNTEEGCRENIDHLLSTYPDLGVLVTTTPLETEATVSYLREKGLGEKIRVAGLADTEKADAYLQSGSACEGVVLCDGETLGERLAEAAVALTEDGWMPEAGTVFRGSGDFSATLQDGAEIYDSKSALPVLYTRDEPEMRMNSQ